MPHFGLTVQNPAIDLGTLPGFTGSRGLGINPRGKMVGVAYPLSSAVGLYFGQAVKVRPWNCPVCRSDF